MKAIQYSQYGDSGVLQLKKVEKPAYAKDEILVKVIATTVNPWDIKVRSGFMQKMMPVTFPYTPGIDVVGVVEAVGSIVTKVKPGDEIYASIPNGGFAEYVCIKEGPAALVPKNISANEAVALVIPVTTSYTLLVEAGQLQAGQKILIHGAAGGVGSTMVQMAKAMGAYVIGTATGEGIDIARKLGADEVIDYKTQDFSQLVSGMYIVADLIGGETQNKSFEVLKKGGKLISTVMPPSTELAEKFGVTAQFINSTASAKKLDFAKQWIEEGKIKGQIAKTMKLEQAATAQDLITNGGVNGKIVLEIN
jgi:NADPH:quinone reductase-like Zn-dependent oxidoreductase